MPIVLCIETSSSFCSVALIHLEKIIYLESQKAQSHAEILSDLIMNCLKQAGLGFNKLQAVAISEGPGSYTGLRIGTSTAKGLCFALGIPLINISTLKILALAALEKGARGLIWPMIDARRMEVYHCVFDQKLNALTQVLNGIVTDKGFVPGMIDNMTVICGDGSEKAGILNLQHISVGLNASTMCHLATEAYNANHFANLVTFEPFYLKQANITSANTNS